MGSMPLLKWRRALVLAVVLPLLGGCFVTSREPILRAGETGRDPALKGLWVSDNGREFLHVLDPEPADGRNEADQPPGYPALYVIYEGEQSDDRSSWNRVQMIATTVKDTGILSVLLQPGAGNGEMPETPGWLIFSYEIVDDRFHLHAIDEGIINDALSAGKLKGKPATRKYGDPHVTASAQEWIAWLEQTDFTNLFSDDQDSYLLQLSEEKIRTAVGPQEPTGEGGN